MMKTATGMRRMVLATCVLAGVMALSACSVTSESVLDLAPEVATVSRPNDALRRMPEPRERTVVAVYAYNDLTGQYRERDNVQTLSRAVTQGGAPVLIKALQDAGEGRWFTVLERSELDNLLRERQILTEMRRIYRNENQVNASVLPPLLHASIIIEGGIIGYDTNTVTGGVGARFLGIGASQRYLQDTVTVSLRAVSTKTGEVLTTVTTRKAVVSHALQGGAFRYLKLDELLEAETGVTYNEPKQIAVESAIEEAVRSLIVEGSAIGIWSFRDGAAGQQFVADYRDRKYRERLTLAAETPVAPRTQGANQIADTVARAPQPVQVRTIRPAQSQAQPGAAPAQQQVPQQSLPPAPEPGETLGSNDQGTRVNSAEMAALTN